jgi:hypothetical protein
MSWAGHIAAEVEVATHGQFPEEIMAIIGDYATMLSAGDWCLMKKDDKGYKIGVITHVVQRSMDRNCVAREVDVHQCGREISGERDGYEEHYKKALDDMDAARGPMETLHAPRYKGRHPYGNGKNVNVYTDTGRVPFGWVRPVIISIRHTVRATPHDNSFRIVAVGKRTKIESLFQRLAPSKQIIVEDWESDDEDYGSGDDSWESEEGAWEGDAVEEADGEAASEEDTAQERAAVEEDGSQASSSLEVTVGEVDGAEEAAGLRRLSGKRKRLEE